MNRPRFANIVSTLSASLEAMAGYLQLDVGAFGETTEQIGEGREGLELDKEQSLSHVSSAKEQRRDEATETEESTV